VVELSLVKKKLQEGESFIFSW